MADHKEDQTKETIEQRKSEHIDIVLKEDVSGQGITTGFEKYRLIHQALPEINFSDISLETSFLHKRIKTPFLISSMTGGTERAKRINEHLGAAAEERGWVMGVGSTRAALEHENLVPTFNVRSVAPTIPIIANLGAVQLNYGYSVEECQRAVDLIQADALVFHLNSIQEVFQYGGNTNFSDLLKKIEDVCQTLSCPVGVKEVGWGINGKLAKKLFDAGVSFVDVAGAGGTSWSQVEKMRAKSPLMRKAAEAFQDWGIPTAKALVDVRKAAEHGIVIASGGMKSGVDAAKAIALGADIVGFGRSLLDKADQTTEAVLEKLEQIELELKIAMFGVGQPTIDVLKTEGNIMEG